MTGRRLAVLAPILGAPSETFIARHVTDLADDVLFAHFVRPDARPYWRPTGPVVDLSEGVSYVDRAVAKLRGQREAMDRPKLRRALLAALREHRIDVVLAEYLTPWSGAVDELMEDGFEVWGHAHGYDVSSALRDQRGRRAARSWGRATGVITMSGHTVDRLEACGIDRERIAVVPYGTDASPPMTSSSRNRTVLVVGRLVGKKHPVGVVKAFAASGLANDGWSLRILGEGPLRADVEGVIEDLGLVGRAELLGAQTNHEVRAEMELAGILVQFSRTDPDSGDEEGLPVAVLEAMATGLPVIASTHAGLPEAVVPGVTGVLVPEGDETALAQELAGLGADADRRATLGGAARRRFEERFTWQRERDALRSLLRL